MRHRIQAWLERVRTFVAEVHTELKKCTWPTRSELIESTWVVMASVVLLGAYVGLCDAVLVTALRWLLR